jgi:diguanylate cyclase (GGDEF)-like protein/PAS domain S-box-containing protein
MKNHLEKYLKESPTVYFIIKKIEGTWELYFVSSNVFNIYGKEAEDFISKRVKHEDFIHPEDIKSYRNQRREVSKIIKNEYNFKPYRIIKIIKDKNDNTSHYYGYLTDITEYQKTKKNLNQYFNIINENVLICVTDTKGKILDVSNAYCKLTGYKKEELINHTHRILKHPDSKENYRDLWETINQGAIWKGEHQNIKKDGSSFWVENSITPNYDDNHNIIGFTSIYNDITDKKKIIELSITDHLTKLYNRRHFNYIFDIELKRAKREQHSFALMILDIDYFKQYNDSYGHIEGDNILVNISKAIKDSLKRPQDFSFRIGGEEFAIITTNCTKDGLEKLIDKIFNAIENLNIEHKSSKVKNNISISMGIKYFEKIPLELNQNTIFKEADDLLYEAKENGRDRYIIS